MSTVSMLNLTSSVASSAMRASGAGSAPEQTLSSGDNLGPDLATHTVERMIEISDAAQAAASGKKDEAEDFIQLSQDVRAMLNKQRAAAYANGSPNSTPSLSGLSGRELAAISLNRASSFSQSEVNAAQNELLGRENRIFTQITTNAEDWTSGVSAYSQDMIGRFDMMSREERQALGWTEQSRAQAAAFVEQASGQQN